MENIPGRSGHSSLFCLNEIHDQVRGRRPRRRYKQPFPAPKLRRRTTQKRSIGIVDDATLPSSTMIDRNPLVDIAIPTGSHSTIHARNVSALSRIRVPPCQTRPCVPFHVHTIPYPLHPVPPLDIFIPSVCLSRDTVPHPSNIRARLCATVHARTSCPPGLCVSCSEKKPESSIIKEPIEIATGRKEGRNVGRLDQIQIHLNDDALTATPVPRSFPSRCSLRRKGACVPTAAAAMRNIICRGGRVTSSLLDFLMEERVYARRHARRVAARTRKLVKEMNKGGWGSQLGKLPPLTDKPRRPGV